MGAKSMIEIARTDLFTAAADLRTRYTEATVERVLRVRDMYLWATANPDAKDRQFVEEVSCRYDVSRATAYADLAVVKQLLPTIGTATRDYHRWRYNEMILETYQMAKKRKDTKTMERAASSYAKYNRIDTEDEASLPYDVIVVQPFTATSDPSVLGIKPIPNIQERIQAMLKKYRAESMDIEDVQYEEADLELDVLLPTGNKEEAYGAGE